MSKLTPAQISHAKSLGFLQNRGTNCFSGRAITKNGVLSAEQLKNLAECAEQYGLSLIHILKWNMLSARKATAL